MNLYFFIRREDWKSGISHLSLMWLLVVIRRVANNVHTFDKTTGYVQKKLSVMWESFKHTNIIKHYFQKLILGLLIWLSCTPSPTSNLVSIANFWTYPRARRLVKNIHIVWFRPYNIFWWNLENSLLFDDGQFYQKYQKFGLLEAWNFVFRSLGSLTLVRPLTSILFKNKKVFH